MRVEGPCWGTVGGPQVLLTKEEDLHSTWRTPEFWSGELSGVGYTAVVAVYVMKLCPSCYIIMSSVAPKASMEGKKKKSFDYGIFSILSQGRNYVRDYD